MNLSRHFTQIYLLSLVLLGIGYVSILPLFEGIDEAAYFSSIRQIAATGTIPILGKSFLDEVTRRYQGPVHYSTGSPPFDTGLTYPKFFARPGLVQKYVAATRTSLPPVPFQASPKFNYEAQQPPLYYVMMAPFDKLADFLSLSLYARVVLFRLASYGMALIGVGLGLVAARDPGKPLRSDPAVIGFLFYPFLLPQFFNEFGRIGNDALCLLLVGLAAFLMSKWIHRDRDQILSLGIGVVLGLGLLTKAFFAPIILAIGIWLIFRNLSGNRPVSSGLVNLLPSCMIVLPAVLIGGVWYLYNFFAVGLLSASYDMLLLASKGGLAANIVKGFSPSELVRGIAAMFATYSWGGTWSLVRVPAFLQFLMIVPAAAAFMTFGLRLKNYALGGLEWLGVLVFAVFAAALIYYIVISMAAEGYAGIPGWYLHILMPWIAPPLGIGLIALLQKPTLRPYMITLVVLYPLLFQAIAIWLQITLFAGCAAKGADKYYVFPGHTFCLDRFGLIMDRMAILGSPQPAMACFAAGLACTIFLLGGANAFSLKRAP